MPVRVLGIDPGLTRCGVGVVDVSGNRSASLVEVTVLRSDPEMPLERRLLLISDGIEDMLDRHQPAFVAIERELAVLVARRPGGQAVAYPITETVQAEGICRELLVPAPVTDGRAAEATALGLRIAEIVDVAGVMAVELFDTAGGLVVNELACRPHNSGHWTIEGAATSQFANHLRAVLDWPLGSTALIAEAAVTVNVLGSRDGADPSDRLPAALTVEGVSVHLYGKAARPGRKLGHVTALGSDLTDTRARARHAAALLSGEATT